MKKLYFLFLLLWPVVFFAQIVDIPDANFKAKLLSSSPANHVTYSLSNAWVAIDANGDGEIEASEAADIKELIVIASSISSLEGIQSFVNLRSLYCDGNTNLRA